MVQGPLCNYSWERKDLVVISRIMKVTLENGKDLSINIFVWWRVVLEYNKGEGFFCKKG